MNFEERKYSELHNFVNASQIANGAVSYLRMVDTKDSIHCAFLMGKTRLAHTESMTVARLEFLAAVLAVQLNKTLKEERVVASTRSIFCRDSICVLQYIRNTSERFHTFVSSRLAIITRIPHPVSGDTLVPS